MTIGTTIILTLLLHSAFSYITSEQVSHNLVQTKRIQFNSILVTPVRSLLHNIVYDNPFTNPPQIIISLIKMDYCSPPDGSQLFLRHQKTSHITYAQIQILWSQPNKMNLLSVSYFAFDTVLTTSLYFYQHSVTILNTQTAKTSDLSTGSLNIGAANVCFRCYFDSNDGYLISIPYRVIIECNKLNPNTIRIQTQLPHGVDGSLRDAINVYKVIKVSVLILVPDNSMDVGCNRLVAKNSVISSDLGFIINTPSSYFFIGLSKFIMPSICVYFGLLDNNQQIGIYSPFIQLQYQFLLVTKNQVGPRGTELDRIQSYVFSLDVAFVYEKMQNRTEVYLNQFSHNCSWLTEKQIKQFSSTSSIFYFVTYSIFPNSDKVQIIYNYSLSTQMMIKKTVLRLVVIEQIQMDVIERNIRVKLINTNSIHLSQIQVDKKMFKLNNGILINGSSIVDLQFQSRCLGSYQLIIYKDYINGDKSHMTFILPLVQSIKTSSIRKDVKISIIKIGSGLPWSTTQLTLDPNSCFQNFTLSDTGIQIVLNYDYDINKAPLTTPIVMNYKYNPISNYKLQMTFKVLTLLYQRTIQKQNRVQFLFVNIKNPHNVTVDDVKFNIQQVTKSHTRITNDQLILIADYTKNSINILFQLSLSQVDTGYSVVIQDLKIIQRFIRIQCVRFQNNLKIILDNFDGVTSANIPFIALNMSTISIQSIVVTSNTIQIHTVYNSTIDQQNLEISYENTPETIFYQRIAINLDYQFPIVYCVGLFQNLNSLYSLFSTIIQFCYLATFVYASICDNKLLALQTLFIVQLTYYSFISIGIYCQPFLGLTKMKYVSGSNFLFRNLDSVKLLANYSILGISSNFISNVNLMLFPIILCPIFGGILTCAGRYSNSYKHKPRCLKYGKAFILEIPFTILIFNSFNIYSSFVVQLQSFSVSKDVKSLTVAVIVAALLPIFLVIYWIFRKHYCQFGQKFDFVSKIRYFTQETSLKIRQMYPFVMTLQYILIPTLLSIQKLFQYSIMITTVITALTLVFVILSLPYLHKIDNVRLIIHRTIILVLCGTLICFKIMMNDDHAPEESLVYWMPLVVLIIITIAILLNGLDVMRRTVTWIKKRGIIDHSLKMKQEATLKKPIYNEGPVDDSKWYPALQFGQYGRHNMPPRNKNNQNQRMNIKQNYIQVHNQQSPE